MNVQVLDARRDVSGGYKVDVSRGQRIGRVSSEWFSRPDDERFLSLGDLARSVRGRSDRSRTRVVETALIHVEANRNDPERLALMLPGAEAPVTPTHWSFGQLASQVGAPAAYLRQLPAPLAAINAVTAELTSKKGRSIAMALMVIGYPLGGIIIGYGLDRLLHTTPWITIGLMFAAFIAACFQVMTKLRT